MNKINLSIDTIPYLPDTFNNTKILYESEPINNNNSIPTHQSIFIFSLKYTDGDINLLNKYNNPYYMLYGLAEPSVTYSMPPINYFSVSSQSSTFYSSTSNLIKSVYNSYVFTPDIINLLGNIGYDVSPISSSDFTPQNLFPPSTFINPPNNSPLYDNKLLFQKLIIYDAVIGRNDEIIFIFFYQNYIDSTIISPNNSYIYNTSQNPFVSSVYYEKKNWNVFIYPYTTVIDYDYESPSYYINIINTNNSNINNSNVNHVECLNFVNEDYVQYINKIEYKYFEIKHLF